MVGLARGGVWRGEGVGGVVSVRHVDEAGDGGTYEWWSRAREGLPEKRELEAQSSVKNGSSGRGTRLLGPLPWDGPERTKLDIRWWVVSREFDIDDSRVSQIISNLTFCNLIHVDPDLGTAVPRCCRGYRGPPSDASTTSPSATRYRAYRPQLSPPPLSVARLPTTNSPLLARVSPTFNLRLSPRNPMWPPPLFRTVENTITSFSRPSNPSTVLISMFATCIARWSPSTSLNRCRYVASVFSSRLTNAI